MQYQIVGHKLARRIIQTNQLSAKKHFILSLQKHCLSVYILPDACI